MKSGQDYIDHTEEIAEKLVGDWETVVFLLKCLFMMYKYVSNANGHL